MKRYFIECTNAGTTSLKMEAELFHYFRERWNHCIVSDKALVRILGCVRGQQTRMSNENPRLRTVEITMYAPVPSSLTWPVFFRIGAISIPLKPVVEMFDE